MTVKEIEELFVKFSADAEKAEKGNASAGARSRKLIVPIVTALKEYRKESVEWSRK